MEQKHLNLLSMQRRLMIIMGKGPTNMTLTEIWVMGPLILKWSSAINQLNLDGLSLVDTLSLMWKCISPKSPDEQRTIVRYLSLTTWTFLDGCQVQELGFIFNMPLWMVLMSWIMILKIHSFNYPRLINITSYVE